MWKIFLKMPPTTAPIYKQVAEKLRQEILKGTYLVGQNLPPEKQLAEIFNASRHTIREALRDLREDGVIASRQGSGSVVCSTPNGQSFVHETSTINEIDQYASSSIKVLNNAVVDLEKELLDAVGLQESAAWMRIDGFRYLENESEPICMTHAFLHPDFFGVARLFGKRATPLYELIEDNFGVVIHEVQQRIIACTVNEKIGDVLGLPVGSMAIEIQRFYKLKDGKVVEMSRNIYPPHKFNFSLKLKRNNF